MAANIRNNIRYCFTKFYIRPVPRQNIGAGSIPLIFLNQISSSVFCAAKKYTGFIHFFEGIYCDLVQIAVFWMSNDLKKRIISFLFRSSLKSKVSPVFKEPAYWEISSFSGFESFYYFFRYCSVLSLHYPPYNKRL